MVRTRFLSKLTNTVDRKVIGWVVRKTRDIQKGVKIVNDRLVAWYTPKAKQNDTNEGREKGSAYLLLYCTKCLFISVLYCNVVMQKNAVERMYH